MLKNKIRDVSSSWVQHYCENDAETRELNQELVQIGSVLTEANLKAILKPLNFKLKVNSSNFHYQFWT